MNPLIVFGAKYLFIVIGLIALLVFMFANQQTKMRLIRLGVFTFPLAYLVGLILNAIVYSPRPFAAKSRLWVRDEGD